LRQAYDYWQDQPGNYLSKTNDYFAFRGLRTLLPRLVCPPFQYSKMGLDHSHQSVKTLNGDCYKLDLLLCNRPGLSELTDKPSTFRLKAKLLRVFGFIQTFATSFTHFPSTDQGLKRMAHIALGFAQRVSYFAGGTSTHSTSQWPPFHSF
jgi:hypothetical protein